MDIENLFLTRQSTREYKNEQIPQEILKKICALASLAPSAINSQPYEVFVISGEKARSFAKNVQVGGRNLWTSDCPAFMVIKTRPPLEIKRGEKTLTNAPFIENDAGTLAAYIVLAAESLGVQSCIIGLRDEDGISEFLGLEKGERYPLVIALGYKKDGYPVREKTRRPLNQTFKFVK